MRTPTSYGAAALALALLGPLGLLGLLGLCLTTACGGAGPSEVAAGAGGAATTGTASPVTSVTVGAGGGGGGGAAPCGFSNSYGDSYAQNLTSESVDATGAIVLGGAFVGTLSFDGRVLESGATAAGPLIGGAAFLARLDPQGNTLWAKQFGVPDQDRSVGTAVDAQGDIFFTTSATEPIDLGGGPLTPGGAFDSFLAKIGPDGETLWSRPVLDAPGVDGSVSVLALRTDGQGDAFLFGVVDGAEHRSLYLTKIDPSGQDVWTTTIVADEGFLVTSGEQAIAVDRTGAVTLLMAVWAVGPTGADATIDLGDGPLTVAAGANNAILARFDPGGALVYSRLMDQLSGLGNDFAESGPVVAGPNGDVYLSAMFGGTVDVGGGPMAATANGSLYVARIDTTGHTVWSAMFGDDAYVTSLLLPGDGRLVMGGDVDGSIDLGGGPLVNDDKNTDIFVGALDATTGAPVTGRRYGSGTAVLLSIGMQPAGSIIGAGVLLGGLDVCGNQMFSAGQEDVFVADLGQ